MLRITGYSETSQESFHRHANCAVSNDKLWIVKGNSLEINIYAAPDSKGVLDSTYILHPNNQCQLIHALDQPINGLSTIDKNVILILILADIIGVCIYFYIILYILY